MSRDLFEHAQTENSPSGPVSGPLAHRMRPRDLDDFVGQERWLGPGKPLRRWIETDRVPSLILWGPPGCGKTTLAKIIAHRTQARFQELSAVQAGVKDLKEAAERAQQLRRFENRRTLLFVDEIHRFNKGQQDALLPHVEDGTFILVGATTENPSFELNRALLSRMRVVRLDSLGADAVRRILERALSEPERGLGGWFQVSSEVLDWLSASSEGDARRALTALETLALQAGGAPLESGPLSLEAARHFLESALERQPIPYDKDGEEHHNVVSAFIKSIRNGDPDAGLYYLARMLEGGEDPLFIARRLVILASEDVGNADPRALQVAVAGMQAVDLIGLPEGRINLAQVVTYLASAPKSDASYAGIQMALAEVQLSGALPVPMAIRNAPTALMKNEGYGCGYQSIHENPAGARRLEYLPEKLRGRRFYLPKDSGLEKQIRASLELRKGIAQPQSSAVEQNVASAQNLVGTPSAASAQNTASAQSAAEPAKAELTAPAELARSAPASSLESAGDSGSANG